MDILIAIIVTALVVGSSAFLLGRRRAPKSTVVYLPELRSHLPDSQDRIAARYRVTVDDVVVFASDDRHEAQERRRAERRDGRQAVLVDNNL